MTHGFSFCLVVLIGVKAAAAGPPARFGPPKDSRWEPIPALTDEFDGGSLDPRKWYPNNPHWKGRKPGFFHTGNVSVSDRKLHLTMKREDLPGLPKGYHTYTSAAVKSKATVRYGYFEIKCRPMSSRGSSALWFYDSTPEIWTEIDVFEMGAGAPRHQSTVHMNAHVFHTLANPGRHWSKGGKWKAPYKLADGYRVYALEWNRDKIKYYVDGAVVREMDNTHWRQPLYLNFDSETMPKWFGLPEKGTLPSTFSIEYVRAWKKAGGPKAEAIRSCEFLFPGKRPKSAVGKKTTYGLKTDDGGTLLVIAQLGETPRPQRVTLEYENDEFYGSQTAKDVRRTMRIQDKRNRQLLLTFWWSRNRKEKRNNSYRAERVEIRPATKPAGGAEASYEFVSQNGHHVQVKIWY